MSMINVKTRLLNCEGSTVADSTVMENLKRNGALAGLGECEIDPMTGECYTGAGPVTGGTTYRPANTGAGSGWASISDLLKLGLTIAGQAYLNNNQARIATYGPNGTVLYQTSQIPSQYINPALVAGGGGGIGRGGVGAGGGLEMSTTAVVMVGVAALAVVMMMSRR